MGLLDQTVATVSDALRGAVKTAELVVELPERSARALGDLAAVARVARDIPERLDALDKRAASVQQQIDQMLELGERVVELGEEVTGLGVVIAERANEVATRGAEVVAVLPTLERAIGLAQPLEGAINQLGRVADRLPGGAGRRPPPPSNT